MRSRRPLAAGYDGSHGRPVTPVRHGHAGNAGTGWSGDGICDFSAPGQRPADVHGGVSMAVPSQGGSPPRGQRGKDPGDIHP